MLKDVLGVVKQNLLSSPPPQKSGFSFLFLILILKKYFQESPIFLQIKKKSLIEN